MEPSQVINSGTTQNDVTDFMFTPYLAGLYKLSNTNDIQEYTSKFEFLSPTVVKIIFDFSTVEFIEDRVGTTFNLSRTQKEEVTNLIRQVLLGEIFIGDFVKTIQNKLAVDAEKSESIGGMIVSELFPPAVESLRRVQRIKFPNRIQDLVKERAAEIKTGAPNITPPLQPNQQPAKQPILQTNSTQQVIAPKPSIPATPSLSSTPQPEQSKPTPAPVNPANTIQEKDLSPRTPPPVITPNLIPNKPSEPLPVQRPPIPPMQSQAPAQRPPLSMPPRPSDSVTGPMNPVKPAVVIPKPVTPPLKRPEFKIPDLGNLDAQMNENTKSSNSSAQTSLEAELEKVANVIDLRTQSGE